ncbi:MAG: (d)CMP kinase [Oscillospiraceae bacterium]|nr:(d)CMP kinase [Oscillospiraceae bacterium]
MNKVYSIAIDGPAGAGKSTMARRAAAELNFVYVDTGAIYRTVAYAVIKRGILPEETEKIDALLPELRVKLAWKDGVQHTYLGGADVSKKIRLPEVSSMASKVSALPSVRAFLLDTQRNVAKSNSVIMDGRDIGTVVLPNADVKIYLSASAEVRAKRRLLELQEQGRSDTYEDVLKDMIERDYRDMHREIAPLKQADDAVLLDTSELSLEESIEAILRIIREKLGL